MLSKRSPSACRALTASWLVNEPRVSRPQRHLSPRALGTLLAGGARGRPAATPLVYHQSEVNKQETEPGLVLIGDVDALSADPTTLLVTVQFCFFCHTIVVMLFLYVHKST